MEILDSEYQIEFDKRQIQKEDLKNKIDDYKDQLLELENLHKQKQSSLMSLTKEFNSQENSYTELLSDKKTVESELQELQQQIQLGKEENSALLAKLKEKEEQILADAKKQYDDIIVNAQKDAEAIIKKAENEYLEQSKVVEQELVARRVAGNEELKKELQQREREYEQKRKLEIREVMDELQVGILPLIDKIPSLEDENKKLLFNQIKKINKAVLTGESIEHQNRAKSLLSFNPQEAHNNRKYWHKVGYIATALSILLITYIISPKFYTSLGYRFLTLITPDAQLQELMAQKHFERLRKLREFIPDTTHEFKSSYTDNILYTTNYLETVTNDDYKKDWTLGLNKFFLNLNCMRLQS